MTSIMFFLIFIPILGLILLNLNFFLAPHKPYKEKKTPFECGYHSFTTQNRTPFTVSFFIFGILFLLFDLEITTAFPFVVSSNFNNPYGFSVLISFILILTLGFVFELGKNALKIDTKQDKSSLEASILNSTSSPKPHAFVSLPLQSSFSASNIGCYFAVHSCIRAPLSI